MDLPNLSWGKRTADGRSYELAGHLIDTGIIAELLWDRTFESNTKRWMSERLGPDARQRIALLAASHDCGKLAPTFQCRLLDSQRPSWACAPSDADLPKDTDLDALRLVNACYRSFLAHATESGRTLARIGADPWWSRVVEGHHGRFRSPDDDDQQLTLQRFQRALNQGPWPQRQRALLELVRDIFNPAEDFGPIDADSLQAVAAIQAAGWVSVADWLASDEAAVDSGIEAQHLIGSDVEAFIGLRRAYFAGALERQLGNHLAPNTAFSTVFGFEPNRPVQQFVLSGDPAEFCLIAVPMGAGKTEAALERHRRLNSTSLYFALPTMATADAMFKRVQRFYSRSDEASTGALLHGRASINDFYAGAGDSDFSHVGDDDAAFGSTGLVASQWLRGRHRGLLAPVGVGTVDQVFASVLRAKYSTVRLAAVGNTHVVFDEVHSYDPYQQQLFCTVLRWLGILRSPTTLLSATIPSDLAHRYAQAYLAGWHCHPSIENSSTWSVAYPGAVTISGGGEPEVRSLDASDERVVELELNRAGPGRDEVSRQIAQRCRDLRRLYPDAVIGVIVNRVAHCIEIAAELEDLDPFVLHARMPTAMRAQRQEDLAQAVGPGSTAHGQLVIGTQVLEQSLDIDFDILVSEFAPAPDLIQRTGRLWRHSTCLSEQWIHPKSRPRAGLGTRPKMVAFAPHDFSLGSSRPYMPGVLIQAWERGFESGNATVIAVPGDLQHIVDCSHVSFTAEAWQNDDTAEFLVSVRAQRASAEDRSICLDVLLDCWGDEMLPDVTSGGADAEDEHATRWNEQPSETIVLVSESNQWATSARSLAARGAERQRAMVGASISLSGTTLDRVKPELQDLNKLVDDPPRWSLGSYLDLDCSQVARLDDALGLIVTQKPNPSKG